jgi:hypothetical protein
VSVVRAPRLLFVLSDDFGELFNAAYLVKDRAFEPLFLMPPRLHDVNREGFPWPLARFASAAEILAAVDRERPDVVLLFSGYLYTVNRILAMSEIEPLIAELERRPPRVVTSDPSNGVVAELCEVTFSEDFADRPWLRRHLEELFRLLGGLLHVYTAPPSTSRVEHVTFSNPRIVPSEDEDAADRGRVSRLGVDPARPWWLFVLSAEDWRLQRDRLGAGAFAALLDEKLRAALRAGRQPVLVAPEDCLAACRVPAGAIAAPACAFASFLPLLERAEYVFYWNVFSASLAARGHARRPAFFFDRGHMSRILRPYLERSSRQFYPGCEVPLLDQRLPLDPAALARAASAQRERLLEPVCRNFARCPAPEEAVRRMLQAR